MNNHIQIQPVEEKNENWITSLITEQWGSVDIIYSGKKYNVLELPGYVAIYDEKPAGLITYQINNDNIQIITLDSLKEGIGIATALVEKVKETAKGKNCKRIWLITTNDNLKALHFYQKRGFTISAVYPNTLEQSRKMKPEIPLSGIGGIPLRDEIELEMKI